MKYLLSLIGCIALLLFVRWDVPPVQSQVPPLPTTAPSSLVQSRDYVRSGRLGITFISSAEKEVPAERYRNALLLGAGWNRFPLYWYRVQPTPDSFDWAQYDDLIREDLRNGLRINAILIGVPEFYQDGDIPQGIREPVFSDGSDIPGDGKTINPNNPWAGYVYATVNRYKPGGDFARQYNLGRGQGVRIWEIWNEPDHEAFWRGSIRDYARLLKVAYIAAKEADPNSVVMFGGLLYSTDVNWLAQVLAIYQGDSQREQFNWFMDVVAVHSYSNPWRSGWLVRFSRETLRAYGLERPIWLNESGIAVWDDYPGPVWMAKQPEQRVRRATLQQQAWYFIQSTAFAWAEGADVVFFHQLYDDCGDQPAGTDFPPHRGELCGGADLCWGDAFGIYRNPQGSICYGQHPFAGSPRPIADAYRLLADVFGREPFVADDIQIIDEHVRAISFLRPQRSERLIVLWNRTLEPRTVEIEAIGGSGRLYALDRTLDIRADDDGFYRIQLQPAIEDAYPDPPPGASSAIGGPPLILLESTLEGVELVGRVQGGGGVVPDATAPPTFVPRTPLPPTPDASIPTPLPPTVNPQDDDNPPTAVVDALPEVSPTVFTIRWTGMDDSAIDRYMIWVRANGGTWQPWLETARTEAEYTGMPGNTYDFAAWAVDVAGNWSINTELQAQATTRVE